MLHGPFMMRSLRWLATTAWTGLTLYLLLSPSGDSTVVGRLSGLTGGGDLAETSAHLILFGVLAVLWNLSLVDLVSVRSAMYIAGLIALLLGAGTELGQREIQTRGASILDVVTDGVGASVALGLTRWRRQVSSGPDAGRPAGRATPAAVVTQDGPAPRSP
jgi:VanZ family protein